MINARNIAKKKKKRRRGEKHERQIIIYTCQKPAITREILLILNTDTPPSVLNDLVNFNQNKQRGIIILCARLRHHVGDKIII